MKKRLMTTLLMLVLLTGLLPVSASAASGLENFTKVNTYLSGQFNDVTSNDWYEQNVVTAFEFGLMQGSGGRGFVQNKSR